MSEDFEVDPSLEGMSEGQLKDSIVRMLKDIDFIENDAKAYAKAARDAIKDKKERIFDCIKQISNLSSRE